MCPVGFSTRQLLFLSTLKGILQKAVSYGMCVAVKRTQQLCVTAQCLHKRKNEGWKWRRWERGIREAVRVGEE